jgi:seryl-tRNA synthetase
MNYSIKNGVYFLDKKLSKLEKHLFDKFCELLENRGFEYLSIPSIVTKETYTRQDTIPVEKVIQVGEDQYLAGSAEQGILEYFTGQHLEESQHIYAKNQCFRNEDKPYQDLVRLKEFNKIEQFVICDKESWKSYFNLLMTNATDFLNRFNIEYRVIDVTDRDPGYHVLKYDIEIKTPKFGWIESHSCTYFSEEQSRRFEITGKTHTISNTGIASPRILLPFIEG